MDRINVYWAAMEARWRVVEALQVTPGQFWLTASIVSRAAGLRRCRLLAVTLFARR